MWAWVVEEPDGRVGIIGAGPVRGGQLPLQSRNRLLVERLRDVAEAHGRAAGSPVRMVHLVEADDE